MHSSLALGELVPIPAEPAGALREKHLPGGICGKNTGLTYVGEVQRPQTAAGLRLQALQSVLRRCQIVRAALDLASIGGHGCGPDGGKLALVQRRGARLCPAIELSAGLLSVAQTLEQLERKTGKRAVALPLRDLLQGRCGTLCALLVSAGKQVRQQQGALHGKAPGRFHAKQKPGCINGVAVEIGERCTHAAFQLFDLCPVSGGFDGKIHMEAWHRRAAALRLHIVAGKNNHVCHAGEVLGDLLRLHDLAVVVVHVQHDAIRQLEAIKAAAAALKFGRHMVEPGSGLKVGKAGDNPAAGV